MPHLLVETDPEFAYLVNVDTGSGPRRFNKSDVVNFLSSHRMGRFVRMLKANGCLDVALAQSEFEACRELGL
jgi:hypothetical protein